MIDPDLARFVTADHACGCAGLHEVGVAAVTKREASVRRLPRRRSVVGQRTRVVGEQIDVHRLGFALDRNVPDQP